MDIEQKLRNLMVEEQLIPRGISDEKVIEAMRKVPRHIFIPEFSLEAAYGDSALPIGEGQTISQPYMVAKMTGELKLSGKEKVLEVGAGSGYQAAVLAELSKEVYTVERDRVLALRAEELLKGIGCQNVTVIVGDGTEGLRDHAPFDRIIVTAGAPDIPSPLIEQLAEGGIIVIPVGNSYLQTLTIGRKKKGKLSVEESIGCVFVPLVGKYGWNKS